MSTPDQGRMLADLGRTVAQAGYDTVVETWKLRRLLAAAELAEAIVGVTSADTYLAALAAYKAARIAR